MIRYKQGIVYWLKALSRFLAAAAWTPAVIAILLLFERTFLFAVPMWIFVAALIVSALYGAAHTWGPRIAEEQLAERGLQTVLDDLLHAHEDHIRSCNVFKKRGRYLHIVAATSKTTKEELDLPWNWEIGQGACGLAVRDGKAYILDLIPYQVETYEQFTHAADSQPRWGLTNRHWALTRAIKHIISIPLYDKEERIIGALTIDTYKDQWPEAEIENSVAQRLAAVSWATQYVGRGLR